jgi:hypothetical protein
MEVLDIDAGEVDRLSSELADELAANDQQPATDPRSVDLRFTHLKAFGLSPFHAHHSMVTGFGDSTLSTRIGSGTHALSFGTPKVVATAHRKNTKARKAFEEAQEPGTLILSPGELRKSQAIADAIRRNKVAERILFTEGTILEGRIEWEWNGRRCRSTPDARNFRTLADLKSCRSAHPERFQRDALKYAYPASMAWYRRAIEAKTGVRPNEIYLIAVESSAPYVVTPFLLTERALEAGDRLVKQWFEQLRVCETTNHWPAYTMNIEPFDVVDFEAEVDLAMRDDDGERSDVAF